MKFWKKIKKEKKKKLHENQSIKASQQESKLLNQRNKNIIECAQILWISKFDPWNVLCGFNFGSM